MRSAYCPWLLIALLATAACGGDLLGAPHDSAGDAATAEDASSLPSQDAGSIETNPPPDAVAVQDAPEIDVGPVCGAESWSTVFESLVTDGGPPPPPGPYPAWSFPTKAYFLDFVRSIAVKFDFVDPTTGIACDTTVAACTYDPTLPCSSPQDVTHSNALKEFTGPDGKQYVWAYYPPLDKWFLAEADRSPQPYRSMVDFNAGCSPGCACDAG